MRPDARRIVVFESDARGHAREWLRHILLAAQRQGIRNRLVLLIAADLADVLTAPLTGGADVVTLSDQEQRRCNTGSPARRGLAKWSVVRRHANRLSADSVFFLGLDHLLAPLALGWRLPGEVPVSGILFRPTAHYSAFDGSVSGVAARLKLTAKRTLMVRALRNPALSSMLSLDPYFPAYARESLPGGGKVVTVDDPAPVQPITKGRVRPSTRSEKISFLLFGEITERKGALQVLHALRLMPLSDLRRVEMTIAGRIDPAIEDRFYQSLRELEFARPESRIRVEDRWIGDEELAELLESTNVILAPYQKFVGSSGVLIRAAQYGKPVICQDFGLLGQFVRDFGLGIATDTTDPEKLSRALALAAEDGLPALSCAARFQDFLKGREADRFGDQVLDAARMTSGTGSITLPALSEPQAAHAEKMVTAVPRLVTRPVARRVK